MREIKFRAWDKVKKSLLRVEIIDYPEWSVSCEDGSTERNSFKNERTDRHVLMQFTGLKDKHGIPIYEGDILKLDLTDFCAVSEDFFMVRADKFHGDICYLTEIVSNSGNDSIEIIGNRYENPELLDNNQ